MEYTVITENPYEEVGNGIPVSDMMRGLPKTGIRSHVPQDMMQQQFRGEPQMQPDTRNQPQQQYIPPEPLYNPQQHLGNLSCRDVFDHIQNCPICDGYFRKDKYYLIIIGILVLTILYILNKK